MALKITPDLVKRIRHLKKLEPEFTLVQIAKRLSVSHSTVAKVIKGIKINRLDKAGNE